MGLEDKPYRVYRGGRVKGKVPTLPRPERERRQPAATDAAAERYTGTGPPPRRAAGRATLARADPGRPDRAARSSGRLRPDEREQRDEDDRDQPEPALARPRRLRGVGPVPGCSAAAAGVRCGLVAGAPLRPRQRRNLALERPPHRRGTACLPAPIRRVRLAAALGVPAAIGIDVGGTKIASGLVSADGTSGRTSSPAAGSQQEFWPPSSRSRAADPEAVAASGSGCRRGSTRSRTAWSVGARAASGSTSPGTRSASDCRWSGQRRERAAVAEWRLGAGRGTRTS